MQGFIVSTLAKGMEVEFARDMADYVTGGKVKVRRWPAAGRGRRQQRGLRLATAPPAAAAPHTGYVPHVAVAKPPACGKLGLQTRLAHIGSDWGSALTHIAHHSVAAHCVSMHTSRLVPHIRQREPMWVSPAWSPRPAPPYMRLQVVEHVTVGLHKIGEAFADMMRGGNLGKAVVKVAASNPYPSGVAVPAAAKE